MTVCLTTMDPKVRFCFIPQMLTFLKGHFLTATEEGDFITGLYLQKIVLVTSCI